MHAWNRLRALRFTFYSSCVAKDNRKWFHIKKFLLTNLETFLVVAVVVKTFLWFSKLCDNSPTQTVNKKTLRVGSSNVLNFSLILLYLQNLSANHRANDRVTLEGQDQTISARFMYGPLDMVSLSGEKVGVTNKVFAQIQRQNHLIHI